MTLAYTYSTIAIRFGNRWIVGRGWSHVQNGPDAWVKRSIRAAIAGVKTRFTGSLQSVFRALVQDPAKSASRFLVSLVFPVLPLRLVHVRQCSRGWKTACPQTKGISNP